MSNSSHFLNIKLKNLLYSFNVGYEIILRSVNNVIDLRADINWESLRTTKNDKFDINVYPNKMCTVPISGKTIVNLDRNILRYKRYDVVIVDVKGSQKLYRPDRIDDKLFRSLKNEAFSLIIRKHGDAKEKLKRIEREKQRSLDMTRRETLKMNKKKYDENENVKISLNTSKVPDLAVDYPKKDDVMYRLFGSSSEDEQPPSVQTKTIGTIEEPKDVGDDSSSSDGTSSSSSSSSSSGDSSESDD